MHPVPPVREGCTKKNAATFPTGPKTLEGIERIRQAVTKHGRYSKQAIAERKLYRSLMQECRETLDAIRK